MSNSQISTVVKVFSWVLMGISAALAVLFFVMGDPETSGQTDYIIVWSYILAGIATALVVFFPIFFLILNPKNAIRALIGIALIGVVFLFGYAFADPTPLHSVTNDPNFSSTNVLVLTDTGIFATYLLFVVALGLLLFTGVRSIFTRS